ncbi:alpha carbonic anhydrase 1, chloroplastic-like [Typha latifolia]|uniref:alpha carbonic anhydrase 1, chloroplastic-like n=1 Tax=Typha latifolia TaxID=4733 RepID=UPI003C302190
MAARGAIFALVIPSFLVVAFTSAHDFVQFGYGGATGPNYWGSLNQEFALCTKGKQQSPIDIANDGVSYDPELESLTRDYDSANATLVDNGINIGLRFHDTVGEVVVNGKNYTLKQLHWHSPSEHTINGQRFPVELHLVHISEDGNITVVAILYKYGHADPFLFQMRDKVAELAKENCSGDEEAHIPAGAVRVKSLSRRTRKYFRYVGSLTTPPCTENVIWNILGKVREMTEEQVAALRAPLSAGYKNNSRPTQPVNGRTVQLYDESPRKSP